MFIMLDKKEALRYANKIKLRAITIKDYILIKLSDEEIVTLFQPETFATTIANADDSELREALDIKVTNAINDAINDDDHDEQYDDDVDDEKCISIMQKEYNKWCKKLKIPKEFSCYNYDSCSECPLHKKYGVKEDKGCVCPDFPEFDEDECYDDEDYDFDAAFFETLYYVSRHKSPPEKKDNKKSHRWKNKSGD